MGATLCGYLQEDNNEEDPEEWLGDSGASSHITHKKKDMTDVKEMRNQCHSGKWSEYEVQAKRLRKTRSYKMGKQ